MSNQPPHQPRPPANPHRNLIIALAALAVALLVAVIAIVAVAVNSDDSGTDNTAAASGEGRVYGPPAPADREDADCVIRDAEYLDTASWADFQTKDGARQPSGVLMLTKEIPLPPDFSPLADIDASPGITQYQDQTIGVIAVPEDGGRADRVVATVDPDGTVVDVSEYSRVSDMPKPFDLVKQRTQGGYYRVEAPDGVQIPAAAAGNEVNMTYASAILPDSFDEEKFWVLLRGSSTLYEAELYRSVENWRELGDTFDTSQCKR